MQPSIVSQTQADVAEPQVSTAKSKIKWWEGLRGGCVCSSKEFFVNSNFNDDDEMELFIAVKMSTKAFVQDLCVRGEKNSFNYFL